MKQLTDNEKQQLDAKIKEERKRQQALRESNPGLPESFKAASAETLGMRRLVPKYLWKYGFLVVILCLLAFSVFLLLEGQDSDSKKALQPQPHDCFNAAIQSYCLLSYDKRLEKLGDENGRMGLDSTCISLYVHFLGSLGIESLDVPSFYNFSGHGSIILLSMKNRVICHKLWGLR